MACRFGCDHGFKNSEGIVPIWSLYVGPKIEVEFHYKGQLVRGEPEVYCSGSADDAAAIAAKYLKGETVILRVNPNNPNDVRLDCKITPLGWIMVAVGVLFSLLILAAIL